MVLRREAPMRASVTFPSRLKDESLALPEHQHEQAEQARKDGT